MSMSIVAQVRAYSKSRGYAKFLLQTIASHINPRDLSAYPSLDALARETTLSKPTVIKLTRGLEALGELEVRRGHGRGHANRYRVTLAYEAPREGSTEEDLDQRKGQGSWNGPAPEGSTEDDGDQPKGKAKLYLLPTATDLEKVNAPLGKGQRRVDSKEVLRTSKEKTERDVCDLEKVKTSEAWMDKPERQSPFWCEAHGFAHYDPVGPADSACRLARGG